MKKHHGVSKWYLEFYIKSSQSVHHPFHYGFSERFVATLGMVLDRFEGRQDHTASHAAIWF